MAGVSLTLIVAAAFSQPDAHTHDVTSRTRLRMRPRTSSSLTSGSKPYPVKTAVEPGVRSILSTSPK